MGEFAGRSLSDDRRQSAAMMEILRRVQSVAGVTHAAIANALPVEGNIQNKMTFEGHPQPKGAEPLLNVNLVTPDFFATLKMRLLAGRGITTNDGAGSPLVAVLSEGLAKRHFPGENPIGKRIVHGGFDSKAPPYTIVGVVSDVKENGLSQSSPGTIYLSWAQDPMNWSVMLVRSSMPDEQIFPALRKTVAEFDHDLPLNHPSMLADEISGSIGQERFTMFMLTIFAGVALVLAAIGVYGVIAYFVAQRTHEIGVRMALGAQRADIVSMIGWRVLGITAVGVGIGLGGAAVGRGLLTKLLFDITALDGPTYVGAALTLVAAAALAALVPTLRATHVSPATTIRAD
jgi:putative ABC transport system permease protein